MENLLARTALADLPGLYILAPITGADAWHVLQALQERPGVFPDYVSYGQAIAQARFVLPAEMFPEIFPNPCWRPGLPLGIEVNPAEITDESRAYLKQVIARNGAVISKHCHLTLTGWQQILGRKLSRRSEIAAAIAECPEAILGNERHLFPRGVDAGRCEIVPLPNGRCVLIPQEALRAAPALGTVQARFAWKGPISKSNDRATFSLADLDKQTFIGLWEQGNRPVPSRVAVHDFFPVQKISPVAFPLRLRDLTSRFGVKASSWRDAMVAILSAHADSDAAREAALGPNHVLRLNAALYNSELAYKASEPCFRATWWKPLEFLKLAFHLDLLTPLSLPALDHWQTTALCRLVQREGTLTRALVKPEAKPGSLVAFWLVEVIDLCF